MSNAIFVFVSSQGYLMHLYKYSLLVEPGYSQNTYMLYTNLSLRWIVHGSHRVNVPKFVPRHRTMYHGSNALNLCWRENSHTFFRPGRHSTLCSTENTEIEVDMMMKLKGGDGWGEVYFWLHMFVSFHLSIIR